MRQMLYKSKETMATEQIISENDAMFRELKAKGWKTADEVLELIPPAIPPLEDYKPTTEAKPASIGIDLDGDNVPDVKVSINEGAASVAIADPVSEPVKHTSKRGRPTKRR